MMPVSLIIGDEVSVSDGVAICVEYLHSRSTQILYTADILRNIHGDHRHQGTNRKQTGLPDRVLAQHPSDQHQTSRDRVNP